MADWLAYCVHEVPAGVLYGHHGANAEECEELQEALRAFEGHVEVTGQRPEHSELIEECTFHFSAYRAYLLQRRSGDSYERFCERAQ
jgi:hypothetical protein